MRQLLQLFCLVCHCPLRAIVFHCAPLCAVVCCCVRSCLSAHGTTFATTNAAGPEKGKKKQQQKKMKKKSNKKLEETNKKLRSFKARDSCKAGETCDFVESSL